MFAKTWRELREFLIDMPPERLDDNISVLIYDEDEFVEVLCFGVNESVPISPNKHDVDFIDTNVLDKGHYFLITR